MSLGIGIMSLACGLGGDDKPKGTPTPSLPQPEDAIAGWVQQNRSVGYVGDCSKSEAGRDAGKLCSSMIGDRGRRRAYAIGPTFSEPTALAIVDDTAEGWVIHSVVNRDVGKDPVVDWPLEVGDRVVVIGLGENDCLSVREQPTQQAKRLVCLADGSTAIVQEGPKDAENYQWWRITTSGAQGSYDGWAAATWLRLEDAVRDALQPKETPTPQ